jgi:hypothetical protein
MTIRIRDGTVCVENIGNGVKSYKQIAPDSLLACIDQSLLRSGITSGLLPRGCLSFTHFDTGEKAVSLLHTEDRSDISYMGTEYKNFPLPRLVFGFKVSREGRVSRCRLGVIANDQMIKPTTNMYHYPLSNVSGFSLCVGNNSMPKCESLHTLGSLPHFILSMPNNNDHFRPSNNKQCLEMRDLLEIMKKKSQDFWYSDILIPNGKTLHDFINEGTDNY